MKEENWHRRHAIQLASQLSEGTEDALAVLRLATELVTGFLSGRGGIPPPEYIQGPLAGLFAGGLLMHRPQCLEMARRRDQNRPPGGAYS
jgi:hypothetical protein